MVIVIGLLVWQPWVGSDVEPTPTPTPTEAPALPGQPFVMPRDPASHGRWGISTQQWQQDSVLLKVWVESDEGEVSYDFMAFSNAEDNIYSPGGATPQPALSWGQLEPGQRAEGYLRIDMPAGPGLLILTTSGGEQMSALPIEA